MPAPLRVAPVKSNCNKAKTLGHGNWRQVTTYAPLSAIRSVISVNLFFHPGTESYYITRLERSMASVHGRAGVKRTTYHSSKKC